MRQIAFFGIVFIGLGIWSFFTKLDGSLMMFGRPVETQPQLAAWMVLHSVIAFTGVCFVVWQIEHRDEA